MNDDPQIGDNSNVEVDFDVLKGILTDLADKAKAVSEANGKVRSALKAVLDEQGWHKGALATIRSIEAMSETGRADFLRSFEPMFDAMMEHKWRDEQQDIFDGSTEDAA